MSRVLGLLMAIAFLPLLLPVFQAADADNSNEAHTGLITPLLAQEDSVSTPSDSPESTTVPYEEGEIDSRGSEVTPYHHQCRIGPHDVYPVKEYDASGELVGEFYPIYQVKLAAGDADGDASHDGFVCTTHMKTLYDMIKLFEDNGGSFEAPI